MSSIIERAREHLDPQTSANALLEVMLLWHQTDQALRVPGGPGSTRILLGRRQAYERVIAIFTGTGRYHVRTVLKAHFDGPAGEMDAR